MKYGNIALQVKVILLPFKENQGKILGSMVYLWIASKMMLMLPVLF